MALHKAGLLLVLSRSNCPLIGCDRSPLPNKACLLFGSHQFHRGLYCLIKLLQRLFFRDWPQNMKLLLVVEIPTSQNRHYRDVYRDWMISLHVLGVFMKTSNKLCNPIMAKWSYTFWSFCVGTFDWGMVSSGPQVCTYGTCLSRSVIKLCSCKPRHLGGK